ncbi:hypothetical protein K523DRAFT_308367 [Schizophyllum commune Tattone D]|nr:hypothetical protein K523DRAFT_308367 [Schizophyllum commune Tattone D]
MGSCLRTIGDDVASGERKLPQVTLNIRDIVPPKDNPNDRSVRHCYIQPRPTYLLGYGMSPSKAYELLKNRGKAEATMKATLDKYLAYIKKQCGITWGDGLKREIWDGEEVWLFWMAESVRKEDIYAVELEEVAGFRRLLGAGADPVLFIYKHPKQYIC